MKYITCLFFINLPFLSHSQGIVTKVDYAIQLSGEGEAVDMMKTKVARTVSLKFGQGILRIDFKGGQRYHDQPWYYLAVPNQNIRYDYFYINPELKVYTSFQDQDLKTLLVFDKMEFNPRPDTVMGHVCRKYTYYYKLYPKHGSKVISNMKTVAYFWLADDLTIDPAFNKYNIDNNSFFFPKATNQCPLKMLAEMFVDNKLLYSATYLATEISKDKLEAAEFAPPHQEQGLKYFEYDGASHY